MTRLQPRRSSNIPGRIVGCRAADDAAVKRWPKSAITLRQGARVRRALSHFDQIIQKAAAPMRAIITAKMMKVSILKIPKEQEHREGGREAQSYVIGVHPATLSLGIGHRA
jgi:hypothetical protein